MVKKILLPLVFVFVTMMQLVSCNGKSQIIRVDKLDDRKISVKYPNTTVVGDETSCAQIFSKDEGYQLVKGFFDVNSDLIKIENDSIVGGNNMSMLYIESDTGFACFTPVKKGLVEMGKWTIIYRDFGTI